MIEKFYLAGALVFGGGHVVLPLLETQFVQSSQISTQIFSWLWYDTGSSRTVIYICRIYRYGHCWCSGSYYCYFRNIFTSVFASGWSATILISLSRIARLRGAMAGANAAVVGILAAALYIPL